MIVIKGILIDRYSRYSGWIRLLGGSSRGSPRSSRTLARQNREFARKETFYPMDLLSILKVISAQGAQSASHSFIDAQKENTGIGNTSVEKEEEENER